MIERTDILLASSRERLTGNGFHHNPRKAPVVAEIAAYGKKGRHNQFPACRRFVFI
jgi:hypothetical protein